MFVTMVMVIAYCYGRRTPTCPRRKGSFLAIFQYGGRERSIAPPSDQKTRFAGFAVRTLRCGPAGRMPSQRGPVRDIVDGGSADLDVYQVCRFAPSRRKTAREENPVLTRVCSRFAAWIAEIGPPEICTPSDAADSG